MMNILTAFTMNRKNEENYNDNNQYKLLRLQTKSPTHQFFHGQWKEVLYFYGLCRNLQTAGNPATEYSECPPAQYLLFKWFHRNIAEIMEHMCYVKVQLL